MTDLAYLSNRVSFFRSQYLTVILLGLAGYELIYITISSYPASPRRITVLVNFQAILLISSGETSNRDIFFTDDAAKKFFPISKISPQEIRHQFFLIWSNLTIMPHIMGLGPVQTSNFTCAESNANEKNLLFSLICIRFGT